MPISTNKPSEAVIPTGAFIPQTTIAVTTAVTSAYFLASAFDKYAVLADISGSAPVTAVITVLKAADTNGTSSAVVTSAAIATSTVTTGQIAWININHQNADPLLPYLAVKIVGATSTSVFTASAMFLGIDPRFAPASDDKLATVTVTN